MSEKHGEDRDPEHIEEKTARDSKAKVFGSTFKIEPNARQSTTPCRRRRRRQHRRRQQFGFSIGFLALASTFAAMLSFVAKRYTARAFTAPLRTAAFRRGLSSVATQPIAPLFATPPVRQQQLVVHGPPGLDLSALKKATSNSKPKPKPKSKKGAAKEAVQHKHRPFKLVIVESPSKCQTISKILQEFVQEKQLDHDYVVTSCMGHIRNLAKQKIDKKQAIVGVDIEGGRYEPQYELLPQKQELVSDLTDWCDRAQQIILATDDDREGEAMAWHLLKLLHKEDHVNGADKQENAHEKLPPARVRFTEITAKAIKESIENPSLSLNDNLVHAQETRRILDRLAGYTVSPLLWKKIAPGLSAGRVQSVGLALIVQKERERLLFQESQYWDIKAGFFPTSISSTGKTFDGQLVSINDQPIVSGSSDFEPRQSNVLVPSSNHKVHLLEDGAMELVENMMDREIWSFKVASVKSTERKLNPQPPFITSTLQQEANRKLGLSVSSSMQMAQQLYENGYISYMRTDSKHLSADASSAIEKEISTKHGGKQNYVPRNYATGKDKGAKKKKDDDSSKPEPQAAHEAIRPSIQPDGGFVSPDDLPSKFTGAVREVYELIYQRTVACQMPVQVSNQTSILIEGTDGERTATFRTSGSVVLSPGFTAVYPRASDKESQILPALREGQVIECDNADPVSHITQPPARYTEASFIQQLEALGVGRPSTYAGVVKTLRDRGYVGSPSSSTSRGAPSGPVNVAQRAAGSEEFATGGNARGPLVPSLTAFVVCSFLEKHCSSYVDPGFTAEMEERLDMIANSELSAGEDDRISYLHEFYGGDDGLAAKVQYINEHVAADEARRASLPSLGWNVTTGDFDSDNNEVGLFVGPWGPYIQKINGEEDDEDKRPPSASLPSGMAADLSTINLDTLSAILSSKENNGVDLGEKPGDGRLIRLKLGRYGAYLQLGEDDEEGTTTHGLPREIGSMKNLDTTMAANKGAKLGDLLGLTLEDAIKYVELPKTVGEIDERPIIAGIGPYGPYLKFNNTYMSLKKSDGDIIDLNETQAVELVTEGIINRKGKVARGVVAEVGEVDGSKVTVKEGRFGIYINWKKVNAKMPNEYMDDPSELPLDVAWELIEAKAGAPPRKKGKAKADNLPPAPKRPPSAYLHFCSEKRPEVSAKLKSIGEVSKELARLWSETTDEDRIPFIKMAKESKAEYQKNMAAWKEDCAKLTKVKGKSSKAKTSENGTAKPKRPKTAYLYFCEATRPAVSEHFTKLGDISKELARKWSEISDADRKQFDDLAASDKERYQNELDGSSGDETSTKKSSPKASKTTKRKKTASKSGTKAKEVSSAKKRGPSAYILFCKEHRSSVVDEEGNKLPLGETTKRLAKMWNESDESTRSRFAAEAERAKELVH